MINHTEEDKEVRVPSGKTDLLSRKTTSSTVKLGPNGVAVLEL